MRLPGRPRGERVLRACFIRTIGYTHYHARENSCHCGVTRSHRADRSGLCADNDYSWFRNRNNNEPDNDKPYYNKPNYYEPNDDQPGYDESKLLSNNEPNGKLEPES